MSFKYGRRQPKNAPAIRFADIRRAGDTPAFPASVDYMTPLDAGWKMLGNDQYGDCVAVTWANERRLATHYLSTENYPSQAQVYAFYKTQNPGFPQQDEGMDIQTALEDLHANGGPDGVKAVAFAKVDHTNEDEVRAAIAAFGSVWVGINVLDANMDEFDNGQPWDYIDSDVDGGHSVIAAGYGVPGPGPLAGSIRFETWAEETSFTDAFWQHQVEEAWVVIWPEHLGAESFESNVSGQALADEYKALTGKTLVIPQPPDPTPPAPGPESNAQALWDVAGPWCSSRRTRKDLVALKAALMSWAQAEGLA